MTLSEWFLRAITARFGDHFIDLSEVTWRVR